MRELTDRELDAVCGGLLNFFTYQNITNHQSNSAAVAQSSGGGFFSGNVAVIGQANGAINTNIN
jgi:hypothetical protein